MTEELRAQIVAALPKLAGAGDDFWNELLQTGVVRAVSAGEFIRMAGDQCEHLPLVLSGAARVYTMGENGQEITLYRIESGESCILTASCILNELTFPAYARTETSTEVVLVPGTALRLWFERFPVWRSYVLALISTRLADVVALVRDVTFLQLDERLAEFLLHARAEDDVVSITHASLASELGTSREVVSRILESFERDGLVRLNRGSIRLRDTERLAARSPR